VFAVTFAYGVSAGLFSVTVISTLQSLAVEEMRGRVMALYATCFNGSALWGGPAFGGLAQWIGVSGALFVTGSICAAIALIVLVWWGHR
jgi:hypothetical protein